MKDIFAKDPVPVESWEGVLDASREGPTCVQFDFVSKEIKGKEDCLALNVYTHTVGHLTSRNGIKLFFKEIGNLVNSRGWTSSGDGVDPRWRIFHGKWQR
jgi:hypothetical protein